jgi:hypothetical protein
MNGRKRSRNRTAPASTSQRMSRHDRQRMARQWSSLSWLGARYLQGVPAGCPSTRQFQPGPERSAARRLLS